MAVSVVDVNGREGDITTTIITTTSTTQMNRTQDCHHHNRRAIVKYDSPLCAVNHPPTLFFRAVGVKVVRVGARSLAV